MRFTNACVQSPICRASRMCFYTGRYASDHGAQWNGFPLRVGEQTLDDHLRRAGMSCWLIGKTHMKADAEGMARLGLTPDSVIGARQAECGFDASAQAERLGLAPRDCRLFMVFDGRFKLMHAEGGFRPMLFDLHADPDEFHDLARSGGHASEIARLYDHLARWGRRMSPRVTRSDADILAMRGRSLRRGILPFLVDGSEVPEELTRKYRGPAPARHTDD